MLIIMLKIGILSSCYYSHLFLTLGVKLLNGSKYIISEEIISEYAVRMNLTITRLKKSDFAEYSCSAVNGYGKAEGIITLKGEQYQATLLECIINLRPD